jgi:hypothetical protein
MTKLKILLQTSAKLYFKGLVQVFVTYIQNSGSNSGKKGYKSTNQMADIGNEIRKYIHPGYCQRFSRLQQKKQPSLQPTSAKSQGSETPSFKQ